MWHPHPGVQGESLRFVASQTPGIKTPRAAAIAGIIFSVSMITGLGIIRFAASSTGTSSDAWFSSGTWRKAVHIALDLAPLSGVSFLWFLGVVRNQLGQREDRFFGTVLLGSGLLFVATMFGAAAVLAASLEASPQAGTSRQNGALLSFGMHLSGFLMNILAVKMAAVFMFSTCTLALRTAFLPRWIAYSGYVCGAILLAVITDWPWIELIFPLWTLSVSLRVLVSELLGGKVRLG